MTEWLRPTELPDLDGVDLCAIDTETNDEGLRADRGSSWPWGGRLCLRDLDRVARGRRDAAASTFRCGMPNSDNFEPAEVYGWLGALVARGMRFITMNGPYDWGWIGTDGGIEMPAGEAIEEIGALATLVDENSRDYSLDGICGRYGLPRKDPALLYEGVRDARAQAEGPARSSTFVN